MLRSEAHAYQVMRHDLKCEIRDCQIWISIAQWEIANSQVHPRIVERLKSVFGAAHHVAINCVEANEARIEEYKRRIRLAQKTLKRYKVDKNG